MSSTPEAANAASLESTSKSGTESKKSALRVTLGAVELARVLRILSPKMTQGPIFGAIDLEVTEDSHDSEAACLVSRHSDKMGTYLQSLWVELPPGSKTEQGEIAIEDIDRFLSCVDSGLFGDVVTLGATESRLKLTGGGADMQIGLVPMNRVARSEVENDYSNGPHGVPIRTSPTRRPAPGSPWSDWVKAGYAVCHLDQEHIQKILAAGRLMAERHDKAVMIRFTQAKGIVAIRAEPTGARAAAVSDPVTVELGKVGEEGSPDFTLATQFNGLDALLGVLKQTKAKETILLYHPAERGGNLLTTELTEKGDPILGLCQTFSGWAVDPPAEKKPKK